MTADKGNRFAVFDCDGTLVDSQHNIVAAMSRAFAAHGLPEPDPVDVRRLVGLHVADAVSRLLPDASNDTVESVGNGFVAAGRVLRERDDHEEPLFPGAVAVLDALAGADMLLAVATGKSRMGLCDKRQCDRLAHLSQHLPCYFDIDTVAPHHLSRSEVACSLLR